MMTRLAESYPPVIFVYKLSIVQFEQSGRWVYQNYLHFFATCPSTINLSGVICAIR